MNISSGVRSGRESTLIEAISQMPSLPILSDMKKREDTPVNLDLAMIGLMMAMSGDAKGVRKFIEGFN